MIDDDQKEILTELINISFGSATATIADLFDNFATLEVPQLNVVDLGKINRFVMEKFDNNKVYLTTQQFNGTFHGEIIIVVDNKSAQNMQAIVDDEEDIDENETQQTILEVSNILGSSCIGKLAELLVTEVVFSPPTIEHTDNLIEDVQDSPYNKVIVISTVLVFNELNIQGDMIILISDEMFVWLEQALDDFVENI
ncbi:MAG: chemotaxis protein CheC [Desulforhopalus sp.]|jgi:chemotaxis protein CheC